MVRSEVSFADPQRIGQNRNAVFEIKWGDHKLFNRDTERAGLINSGGEKRGKIVRAR